MAKMQNYDNSAPYENCPLGVRFMGWKNVGFFSAKKGMFYTKGGF